MRLGLLHNRSIQGITVRQAERDKAERGQRWAAAVRGHARRRMRIRDFPKADFNQDREQVGR